MAINAKDVAPMLQMKLIGGEIVYPSITGVIISLAISSVVQMYALTDLS